MSNITNITQAQFLKARLAAMAAVKEYQDTTDAYIRELENLVCALQAGYSTREAALAARAAKGR